MAERIKIMGQKPYRRKGKNKPVRQYLHMVLHCVFQHFWVITLVDQKYWNLA